VNLEASLERRFQFAIVLCALAYLGLEAVYIARLPLVMDEFSGASQVHRFLTGLPYRDFMPYKTVLGYYLQLPPLWLVHDAWHQLLAIKFFMAVLNAAALCFAAHSLARHYHRAAIVLATVLLISMSTFLERSADLRVDMLTGLFGLFSLLYLLDKRVALAGPFAGLSFLVSQKGLYFLLAGGMAIGTDWALHARDRERLRDVLRYCALSLAPIALYFAFWASLASVDQVFHQVVVKNQGIALIETYDIRHFWLQTLLRNPYFWGISILSLGQLFTLRNQAIDHQTSSVAPTQNLSLFVYGSTMFGLCLWHKQPWPYFFVLLIPTAYVLIVSLFSIEMARTKGLSLAILVPFVLIGVLVPAARIPTVLARDNSFQQFTVVMLEKLLDKEDVYLAGVDLLRTRKQPGRLRWLDANALHRLEQEDPQVLLRYFEQSHVKVIVSNYRIAELPQPLLEYIMLNYYTAFANFLFYGPRIEPEASEFELAFDGSYAILQNGGGGLEIDGRSVASGSMLRLSQGHHQLKASSEVCLRWMPERPERFKQPRFTENRSLFSDVYTY